MKSDNYNQNFLVYVFELKVQPVELFSFPKLLISLPVHLMKISE